MNKEKLLMDQIKLKHCINFTKLLLDCMHGLIHDIQDINPELAFAAIEAQMMLMKTELLLKNPPKDYAIDILIKQKPVVDK